ncbi:MAG: glycoside hydrolase family 18 protein [Phycisphaerales bacterium]|nr:glycoside hydrolase family 18 protein [Phycisphaerales bacterium]
MNRKQRLIAMALALLLPSLALAELDGPINKPFIKSVGAWIFVGEDDRQEGSNYWNSNSSYQSLIQNNVYEAVDVLCIGLINTVQVNATTWPSTTHGGSGWTLHFTGAGHDAGGQVPGAPTMPPGGYTNQTYFEQIIQDARAANPHIRITVGSMYAPGDVFSRIFADPANPQESEARSFAENVAEFCLQHQINGYDIDFEEPLATNTSAEQFNLIMSELGTAFREKYDLAYGRNLWLLMTPAVSNVSVQLNSNSSNIINANLYAMNLQMYNGEYQQTLYWDTLGVNSNLYGYTGSWEVPADSEGNYNPPTPEAVLKDNASSNSQQIMMWRLNSGPPALWQLEQSYQKQLYAATFPQSGDVDGDTDVDSNDLSALHATLGICQEDVNHDGDIDIDDLLLLIESWGESCTP